MSWAFAFEPDKPLRRSGARAGQHGILHMGGAALKAFSVASAPEEDVVLIGDVPRVRECVHSGGWRHCTRGKASCCAVRS